MPSIHGTTIALRSHPGARPIAIACNVPRVVSVKSLTKVTEAKVHTDA